MALSLRLFDTDLLHFEVVENLADPVVRITWFDEEKQHLLPLDLKPTDDELSRWLRHRTIPKNRAYVNSFLAKCGLNANRPLDILRVCHGLSLNDSYWIMDEREKLTFDECNLYENRFSQLLAWTAFTGYGSSVRSSFISSPEFTTNGMLPKCWRRIDGEIYLYKGGTSGFANTGCEPYSELYASQVAEAMGVHHVPYSIRQWKKNTCSVCKLFTSRDVSYVPAGRVVRTGGMKAVREWYESLGEPFVNALNEMIVFDAIVCNADRHYGNFGVLVDSHTRNIISPAPLFDHGNALFNYAGEENWSSEKNLQQYIDTLVPAGYPDFMEEASKCMSHEIRNKVRALLTFKLHPQGRINYAPERLRLIEKQVRLRAQMLL